MKLLPVFNSPLSFLVQKELFWGQFYSFLKSLHGQRHPKQLLPTKAINGGSHQRRTSLLPGTFMQIWDSWGSFFHFNPVCVSQVFPSRNGFLLPQRLFFKPARTSCMDLQGQRISWNTLVLIKSNLSWQDRAAWTALRFCTAILSSKVMSKWCNLDLNRLWGIFSVVPSEPFGAPHILVTTIQALKIVFPLPQLDTVPSVLRQPKSQVSQARQTIFHANLLTLGFLNICLFNNPQIICTENQVICKSSSSSPWHH